MNNLGLSETIKTQYFDAVKKAIGKFSRLATDSNEEIVLPFRPLILARDDICLVSDAKMGLTLAMEILREIENNNGMDMEFHACAGVALAKTQYPFFRAHELAEELCHNAKALLSDAKATDESVIDFHIVQGEIEGTISQIRRAKYQNGKLTNKPFYLNKKEGYSNTIPYFEKRMKILKNENIGRGIIKQYRDALMEGEDKAKEFRVTKRIDHLIGDSFCQHKCTDFDVIEMFDLYNDSCSEEMINE